MWIASLDSAEGKEFGGRVEGRGTQLNSKKPFSKATILEK